jgi:PAS domain S-box-containing protein
MHGSANRIFEVILNPIVEREGTIIGISGVTRDITEHKYLEDQLLAGERNFTSLVENSTDLVVRFDPQFRHIYANPAVERQLGLSVASLLGRTSHEMGEPPEQAAFIETSLRRTKESGSIQEEMADFSLNARKIFLLGLIINELVTNAMKYAFNGRDDGLIRVSASKRDNRATFIFEDNGIGIPESIDVRSSAGFGPQLVDMLTEQLEGALRLERQKGSKFIPEFDI